MIFFFSTVISLLNSRMVHSELSQGHMHLLYNFIFRQKSPTGCYLGSAQTWDLAFTYM